VGKTATLFGSPARGTSPAKKGLLQETMRGFDNPEIYLRIFEIYGLGTQYDFYWNPQDNNGYVPFPDIYQALIHHELDSSSPIITSPDISGKPGSVVFDNRFDVYSYIMDMQYPDNCVGTPTPDPNKLMKLKTGGPGTRHETLNGKTINTGPQLRYNKSTYVKIGQEHVDNFETFITNTIDKKRREGIKFGHYYPFQSRQENPTVNNDKSSRSILVYDFQIKLKHPSGEDIFVPFLIYDLPGKEDIFRTYVIPKPEDYLTPIINPSTGQPEEDPRRKRTFNDIDENNGTITRSTFKYDCKDKKSSLVLNPLLAVLDVPNNQFKNIIDIMIELGTKMDVTLQNKIVGNVLNQEIHTYERDTITNQIKERPTPYKITGMYQVDLQIPQTHPTPSLLVFTNLFDKSKVATDGYYDHNTAAQTSTKIISSLGDIASKQIFYHAYYISEYSTIKFSDNLGEMPFFKQIFIVVIDQLIEYKMFDVLFHIISIVINCLPGSHPKGTDSNNNWKMDGTNDRINLIYEGFYINENVLGIVDYLCKRVDSSYKFNSLDRPSGKYRKQHILDMNFKYSSKYAFYAAKATSTVTLSNSFPIYKIDDGLMKTSDRELQEKIKEFRNVYIDTSDADNVYARYEINGNPVEIKQVFEGLRMEKFLINKGSYDSNQIFRDGSLPTKDAGVDVKRINKDGAEEPLMNVPFIFDFLEPYAAKLDMYYMLYVVSNNRKRLKSEEQIKLINNSMDFIKLLTSQSKKKSCVQ